jgi:hypothetical protein
MTMKRFLMIILFVSVGQFCSPQNSTKVGLNGIVGWKYVRIDYKGGPRIGLSYDWSSFKISYLHDVPFEIGKSSLIIDSSNLVPVLRDFKLLYYKTFDYFEFGYKPPFLFNSHLCLSVGFGWIYRGLKENILFHQDYGYLVSTIAFQYKIDWLTIELRGDLPIKDKYMEELGSVEGRAFPISFSIFYSFKPLRVNQ